MSLDNLIKHAERADKATILNGALDNPQLAAEAEVKKQELVIDYFVNVAKRFKDKAEFNARIPEADRKQIIDEQFKLIPQQSYEEALAVFQSNPDAVLRDKGKYRTSLLTLMGVEDVAKGTAESLGKSKKYVPLVGLYVEHEGLKNLVRSIDEGKDIGDERRAQLIQNASAVKGREKYDELKKKGRTENYAKAGAAIEGLITTSEAKADKDLLKKGLEVTIKETKAKMEKIDVNYEQIIAEGVGNYLTKLSTSSARDKNGQPVSHHVVDNLYYAKTKESIGARDFYKLFPKK